CQANACSRSDMLNAGQRYPAITVIVNVAANAGSPQINQVSVSCGGSTGASASDSTEITTATGAPLINVTINPQIVYLNANQAQQFTAQATGTPIQDVTWTYTPIV